MLQLFDKNKRKIAGLIEYENLCIESILESGDKTLSFSYSTFSKFHDEIEEETYIRTKNDEYVVKAKLANSKDNKTAFTCKLNIEELEGNIFDRFETVEKNIIDCLNQAIVSTGWTINTENCTNKKKRTIRITNCSSWTIIQKAKKLYGIEFKFDTLNKVIMLYDRIGTDKGTYFIDSLNLRALQTQGNSYGFYTRIIPTGKNGLTIASVNGGKIYLENKQYSNKTLTYYWKDERYVKPDSLKEDALEKLNIMSKPFKSYIASTINLVEMNEKYKSILYYNLGDYIYLISKKNNIKDKHRIVKTKEYPQDHSKDTVELANKALDLSEEKLLVDEMNTTLDNVTTDNGTLNGSAIDSIQVKQIEDFRANVIEVVNLKAINASIENLHANKADIQDLNAVKARIGTLEATKANITQLTAVSAEVQQLNAIKANITDLNAATAKIGILEAKTASIDNLLAGNLTADNFKANSITAGSGIIASGAIGSAQISSLSVNKLEAGDITTSKHKIVSADGTIEIVGNQILINRNNVNRVILGEYRKSDGTTEYGLLVRAKDGQTIMLDGNGVHNAGITDGAIDNNKVADNANISGNKLDINSVIREVNNNGTETIKGTKVTVGDRTLDVELSTQKNTITEHGKELSSQKATIQALDNAIKLKVDTQTFTQSTTIINNNINRAKEEAINSANSHADNKANEALNNAKAFVNAEITTVNSHLNKATSEINVLKEKIESKVSQSDIDKAVTTIRTEKIIYARGTGNDFPSNALVKVNGKTITDGQGRGLRINALNKVTLERVFLQDYDTFGSEDAKVSFVNKINELNNGDYIIIITSQDASYPLHPPIKEALEKIGATLFDNKQGTYREAYALIGKSKLGRGNGVEMFIPRTANDKRFAEVSVKVGEDGTFIGVNPNNMGLEATLITSNISDVSSELTQTKNSIEASINSINSKTQSIETNLNGKATKQEVNNRVATIKANLDSITQRVSNTESKTNSLETNINGKASKQELTVVNNKVTEVTASLNGITQRVGNTESRINALDGKVAGAVTLQQFTEFKQSNDKFKFTVEQRSSVSNILPNSSFFGGDRGWLHDGVEFWYGSYSGYGFKGRMTGAIKNRTSYNTPERFLQTHKAYKVKKNTTYTISFHYACEMNIHSMEAYVVLSDTEHGDYAQPIRILEKPGGTQSDPNNDIPFTYKFNTGNHEWVWLRFDHNGMKPGTNWDQYCWLYVSEIGIYEGDVGAVKWTPKGGEVYSANYQMDGLGFKGTFEDGTYAQLGRDGFEWYNAGTGHAYHALTYVTSFDVPIGNPGKAYIKLPAEFTKRRSSLKWTVALRGYYYNTTGNFFPFHVHCTGARDYIENGLVVCEVQGLCKIQNGSNSGDVQFRPLTAMLIAIA